MTKQLSYTDREVIADIANAIREKNGETTTYLMADMPAAIRAIEASGGDPTEVLMTVQASGLVTARDSQGNQVGSMQLQTQEGTTVTPTTSAQTAVAQGRFTTGNVTVAAIPTATLATPTITVSNAGLITATETQGTAGYIAANTTKTATRQLTTKAAATITPGTSNQTIAANTYLTGVQTIEGDADLIPRNIVSTANIFGVQGSLEVVRYYVGTSVPANTVGNNGDLYLIKPASTSSDPVDEDNPIHDEPIDEENMLS